MITALYQGEYCDVLETRISKKLVYLRIKVNHYEIESIAWRME